MKSEGSRPYLSSAIRFVSSLRVEPALVVEVEETTIRELQLRVEESLSGDNGMYLRKEEE